MGGGFVGGGFVDGGFVGGGFVGGSFACGVFVIRSRNKLAKAAGVVHYRGIRADRHHTADNKAQNRAV